MIKRELTCIGCPLGCNLLVEIHDNKEIIVTGNSCNIGKEYGVKECTNPTRIITTTVIVHDGEEATLSVKTERDIPKDKVFDCIDALKDVVVKAPINIGDIIVSNILNTGVNIIATKKI